MNCSVDFYFKNSSLFHACCSAQIACVCVCIYIYIYIYIIVHLYGCLAMYAKESTSHWMQIDWTENWCRKFKYTFLEDEKQLWWTMQTKKIDASSVFSSSWEQCMFWHVFFICVFYFPVIYSFVCGWSDLLAEHVVKSPIKPAYPLLH